MARGGRHYERAHNPGLQRSLQSRRQRRLAPRPTADSTVRARDVTKGGPVPAITPFKHNGLGLNSVRVQLRMGECLGVRRWGMGGAVGEVKLWDVTTGLGSGPSTGTKAGSPAWPSAPTASGSLSGGSELDLSKPDEAVLVPALGDKHRTTRSSPLRGSQGHATSVAFSPDGQGLGWPRPTAEPRHSGGGDHRSRGHRLPRAQWTGSSAAFSPDGKRIASAGGQSFVGKPGEAKLWDATTGHEILDPAWWTRDRSSAWPSALTAMPRLDQAGTAP